MNDHMEPPTTSFANWVSIQSPDRSRFGKVDIHRFGKWCIVRYPAAIDAAWAKVRAMVEANQVISAKASGKFQALRFGTHLICVYTPDWEDKEDVFRVRELLRTAGFVEELGYKRDLETTQGVYGTPNEWFYKD